MNTDNHNIKPATPLEGMIANTCFCKLKTSCADKNSPECMQHRNIYEEFMREKHNQQFKQN